MAKREEKLNIKILSEDGSVFTGEGEALIVPSIAKKDPIAILPYHTPLISLVGNGDVKVLLSEGFRTVATIDKGILYVGDNQATLLVNT
ncbi:MAG: ATP synthase epsilon chain [bacterium ADurb.Bin212]|nr:MAG: ATP synthase epsilon chain [bacterium ADurb.Bin212]